MVSHSRLNGIPKPGRMPPIWFNLPGSFDPAEFLDTPALRKRWDDGRYFMSLILTKFARQDVDERGLVRLKAAYLKQIMHQGTYAAVLKALRLGGAIERFPYAVGYHSFGYRLAERFVTDRHVRVMATDARLIRRLRSFHQELATERDARMLPVHRALERLQTRLGIHGNDARRTLNALPSECNPYDVQGLQIANIERGEFYCNVGRFGRVSNSITSMKRELRPSLHVNGEPLSSVDLSCAQPALLAKTIQEAGQHQSKGKYDSSLSTDFVQYKSLAQAGELYDYILGKLRDYGINRDEFKRQFLMDVLAKKGRYPSVVEDAFRDLFPSVYEFIRNVNRDNHANLIRMLQRAESEFVIETVAADFISRHPTEFLVPLHDSLYSTQRNLRAVEQSFQRGFKRTGFPIRLKVEA